MNRVYIIVLLFAVLLSCSKISSSTSTNTPTVPLLPLKIGNTWIYQDSTSNTSGSLLQNYADTVTATGQTATISGVSFYSVNNPGGYFGTNSSLALDPSNLAIYRLDNLNLYVSPTIFFEITPTDNYLIGTGLDTTNSYCTGTYYAYGFAGTYNINGYSCYKNIDYEKDCLGNIISQNVFYVCPNVGIVRIESYLPVTSGSFNLYLKFSQTLKSYNLN